MKDKQYKQERRTRNYWQSDKFCVYGLLCPISLSIQYIGCTADIRQREQEHYNVPSSLNLTPKEIWVKNLREKGLRPIPVILKEFSAKEEARGYEIELIKKHSETLLNTETIRRGKRPTPQDKLNERINRANKINHNH